MTIVPGWSAVIKALPAESSAPLLRRAVVFLVDGRIVDHMTDPTAERVLDTIKRLRS